MATANTQNLIQKNLASIKRIDPFAEKIIAHALHCAVYDFSLTSKTWEKTEYDGPMFVYKRVDKPYCSFMIANRQSLTDFIEPIMPSLKLKLESPYIFVHKADGSILGLWLANEKECRKMYELLDKIIAANGTVPDDVDVEILVPDSLPLASTSSNVVIKPYPEAANSASDVACMVYTQDQINDMTRNFPKPTKSISSQKPVSLLGPATSHNVHAKKPTQSTANSNFSAPSPAVKNNAGNSIYVSNQITENGLAAALASTSLNESKSNQSAPPIVGLSKEQLLQAMQHLLLTDPEFLDKIHKAYIESLNARLRH